METKELFAKRFKSARLRNGFSLQDLANALGGVLSRQALHRYEKGEVLPDSEKMGMLSKALKISPDYFFRIENADLDSIHYRKLRRYPQKYISKINEITREYISRYLEIENILGISSEFNNPLRDLGKITTYEQVNMAAQFLRKKWSLGNGALINIPRILEDKKIKVLKLVEDENFDSLHTYVDDNIPVIAYNEKKVNNSYEFRFTLLRELAHLLLQFEDLKENQKAVLANQFAGAMLLSEEALKTELGHHRSTLSPYELISIKKRYGISMEVIVKRANLCSIINNNYAKSLLSSVKKRHLRKDESLDFQQTTEVNRLEQLIYRSLLENQISISKAASLLNKSMDEFRKQNQI